MFFNTINESKEQLKESWAHANKQEKEILLAFGDLEKALTPFEVNERMKNVFNKNYPITSIRRAMTSLTVAGLLEKTNERREGGYGKLNYCWKVK